MQSIVAQIYEGLSYGCGDAVIGVNPVTDDVDNLSRVLDAVYGIIDKYDIPTQGCVLAHVTTQMEAIKRGAPGGLIFQSICGSEKVCVSSVLSWKCWTKPATSVRSTTVSPVLTACTLKQDRALHCQRALTTVLTGDYGSP